MTGINTINKVAGEALSGKGSEVNFLPDLGGKSGESGVSILPKIEGGSSGGQDVGGKSLAVHLKNSELGLGNSADSIA